MERAKAMWRRLHLLAWLLALPVAADDPVWQSVSRGSVEVLTTADAVLARTALAELEALRAALASLAPGLARADAPLRIVLFDRESGAAEFRLNAFSPAYYAPGPAWSTIVVFGMDDRSLPSLRHEFIHHLVRAGGRRLPLWLEEGLADALSPLPQSEAQRRVKLLRSGRCIPWRELFEAKPAAALYQDWDSARPFTRRAGRLRKRWFAAPGTNLAGRRSTRGRAQANGPRRRWMHCSNVSSGGPVRRGGNGNWSAGRWKSGRTLRRQVSSGRCWEGSRSSSVISKRPGRACGWRRLSGRKRCPGWGPRVSQGRASPRPRRAWRAAMAHGLADARTLAPSGRARAGLRRTATWLLYLRSCWRSIQTRRRPGWRWSRSTSAARR